MKNSIGIILVLGFLSCFIAYSLYNFLWKGAFYHLTSLGFVCYTYVIYKLSKGKWSLFSFVVFLTALNSLVDELLFDPERISLNEYLGFVLTLIITHLYRGKWERY